MRQFIFSCLLSLPLVISSQLSAIEAIFGEGLDIQLQEAIYGDGIVSTETGGIIRGKDFFLQAKFLKYMRTGEGDSEIHKIVAKDNLFLQYKGRFYHGDRAELDLNSGKLLVWNGCTKSGTWYIGGKEIEIFGDGHGTITNAYITTSENEQSDWSIQASKADITKDSQVRTRNATFNFEKIPLFWVPVFSSDLFKDIRAPVRVRAKFGNGVRLGISYLFRTGSSWRHRALADYSTRFGFGCGVRSQYKPSSGNGFFDALNYIAQDTNRTWGTPRYRMQGLYKNFFPEEGVHVLAMYDKLSDSGMRTDFVDHPITDALAGLTQASLWKTNPDWLARLNARVRVNTFQTVKQQLPLLTFNTRPTRIGSSPIFIDNRVRTGYLSYVYAHQSLSVHNFESTRTELSQRLFTTFSLKPIILSPSIGYHVIHYNRSPQHEERLQAVGDCSLEAKTRFVKNDPHTPQIAEPYALFSSLTSPLVKPGRTYIFDIEDGWQRVNELRYGVRNFWWFSPQDSFQRKLFVDLYARSFFNTPHLTRRPFKLWLDATWDATPTLGFKLNSAWDFIHSRTDHVNIAVKKTFSERFAIMLENRNRSPYDWRKLDRDSFILDATRQKEKLLHSELSDARNTFITRFYWAINPTLDTEFAVYQGWRPRNPHHYYNYEINISTLIRGALRVSLTIIERPGGPRAFYLSCDLGPKKESDRTSFRRIGQGNYDIW